MTSTTLVNLAIMVPLFIVSIALHELAHAASADALGDPTPREQGRLTFNPLAHLDVFGTLMLLIAGFGWAKPVQVKPHLFRYPRLGSFFVSAMGPLTNLALGILAIVALKHIEGLSEGAQLWFVLAGKLNITLAVLNLLPMPPLDGGHLLEALLPRRWLPAYEHLTPYAMVLMILLVVVGGGILGKLFQAAFLLAVALIP